MTPALTSSALGSALPAGSPARLSLPDCSPPSPALCPRRHRAPSIQCVAFLPPRCLPPAFPTLAWPATANIHFLLPSDLSLSALPPRRCSTSVRPARDSNRSPTAASVT